MARLVCWVMIASAWRLPETSDKKPVSFPHFPTTAHAVVWRNWQLVPAERIAKTIGATREDVARMGHAMGLGEPPPIPPEQERRSYITVIRRNWHLLPYSQLLTLLDFTEEKLAFTLREDDFLYVKLGLMKPDCPAVTYEPPDETVRAREQEIARIMQEHFPQGPARLDEPLFQFVSDLAQPLPAPAEHRESRFSPRYCSSYFALYGDPLIDETIDSYPDGYLERLAASGVDGIWMHVVLYQLAPFPWDETLSAQYEKRLARLKALTERARAHGIGVYLYLNEPRAMPLTFFESRPGLKGAIEGDHAALCTSAPEVREYISSSVARICEAAPELEGFFTITASENYTNCWSHGGGAGCSRCGQRPPHEVIAEVNTAVWDGIQRAGARQRLIVWDWGWRDEWAIDAINALPQGVALMSVSEWSIPIERGGVKGVVGEYSISTIGPGPRATKHWAAARARGLGAIAKIQAGVTWELAAVPYIPALANVAQHAVNLRDAGVDGLMLGWSLGGYPSPNLEVVAELGAASAGAPRQAMERVAQRRYGAEHAAAVVSAWERCSAAFSEFPYDGAVVYNAPLQAGPANLLWAHDTKYTATMVGIPYDDLDRWRGPYPEDVFIGQFTKMADGFATALEILRASWGSGAPPTAALAREAGVVEASAIHFRSVANQARFVQARRALSSGPPPETRTRLIGVIRDALAAEIAAAVRLHAIQTHDSRIGYESSNHYFYVPLDLAEKVLNCQDLLDTWLSGSGTAPAL